MRGVYFYRGRWQVYFRRKYQGSFANEKEAEGCRVKLENEYGKLRPFKIDYANRKFGQLTVVGDSPKSIPNKRILIVHNHRDNSYFEIPLYNLLGGDNRGIGYEKRGNNHKNSSSGVYGVSLVKRTGKWQAYIKLPGEKRTNLGTFNTKDEAVAARKAAEHKYLGGN